LSKNDLGLTGGHQAGIVVPREIVKKGFFPFLDQSIKNPRTTIHFQLSDSSILCAQYIYYNSKILGCGTRNEFRLTCLTGYFRSEHLCVGDILKFGKIDNDEALFQLSSIKTKENHNDFDFDKPLIIHADWVY
jgi:hypothetical protein